MRVSITLDLEPDSGGWIPETYTAWDAARVQTLLDVLDGHDVPLSARPITANAPVPMSRTRDPQPSAGAAARTSSGVVTSK